MSYKHILLSTSVVFAGLYGFAGETAAQSKQVIKDSYICVFKDNITKGNAKAEAVRSVNAAQGQLKFVYRNTIRGFSTNMSARAMDLMKARNPNIAYCEQDQVMSTVVQGKGKPGGGGGGTAPAQTTPWGIDRVNGGGANYTGSAVAWVIDTGVDLDHPDLNVNTSAAFDAIRSRDSGNDSNGHGTHVAGTIGAINNSIGVIGVAPGVTIVPVRVLGRRGTGSNAGVIAGVDYVAANGSPGDVANMSLGGGASAALDDAVRSAAQTGVRFVLAAGNEAQNANNVSPARTNGTGIFTISAFDINDRFASFSNFGNPPVDYGEPGVAIPSTYKDGGYATLSGTSMAAPHFAGLLLLGNVQQDGTVIADPDGNPDKIGVK